MGEGKKPLFEPSFNRAVKVHGGQDRLTSDAGTLLLREADHRLSLTQSLAAQLYDRRNSDRTRYTLVELLRERLYALAQGYDAQDDVDELAHDPAMRMATWDRPGKRVQEERAASQPTQSRLLTALGNYKPNIERLRETLADWSGRHLRATGNDHTARRITIDVDSLPIQAYGSQAGVRYNGYYREDVFHPLVASYTVGGDYDGFQSGLRLGQGFIHAVLRAGNVHTASGAKRFFLETARKAKQLGYVAEMRFDAGFAEGAILDFLTEEKIAFLARLKANARLQDLAAPHLKRPPGRPPKYGREVLVEFGRVPGRVLALAATRHFGDRRLPRPQDRPTVPRTRLFLPRHQLLGGRATGGRAAGALSPAWHIRGSAGRVPPMDRPEALLARVRVE